MEVIAMSLPVAIQLYSLRADAAADFRATLEAVKKMGYDGVEFAGLHGNSPEDIKTMCEEIGLTPISAHVPFAELLADTEKVLTSYKTIGCEYVVLPYLDAKYRETRRSSLRQLKKSPPSARPPTRSVSSSFITTTILSS